MGASSSPRRARPLRTLRPPTREARELYRSVIFGAGGTDAESVKAKEGAVDRLAKLLARENDAPALRRVLAELRPLFKVVPKAKTAKIVRGIIDALATVPNCDALQVEVRGAGEVGAGREAHVSPAPGRASG